MAWGLEWFYRTDRIRLSVPMLIDRKTTTGERQVPRGINKNPAIIDPDPAGQMVRNGETGLLVPHGDVEALTAADPRQSPAWSLLALARIMLGCDVTAAVSSPRLPI